MLVVFRNLKFQRYYNSQSAKELFLPPEHVSGRLDNHPVENLNEGDDARISIHASVAPAFVDHSVVLPLIKLINHWQREAGQTRTCHETRWYVQASGQTQPPDPPTLTIHSCVHLKAILLTGEGKTSTVKTET